MSKNQSSPPTMRDDASKQLGLFRLVAVTLAFVMSIRNLPMLAEMGWEQVFYMILAAITFQIPIALVSAELGSSFPSEGGAYSWIKMGLGKKWAFVGAWMFWAMMCVGMVMVASFIASMIAYVFNPALANDRVFIVSVTLLCIWIPTLYNLRGLKASSIVSTVCYFVGVLIPFVLIIGLGLWWFASGNANYLPAFSMDALLPDFHSFDSWSYFAAVILLYSGSEAVAVHAPQTKNVQRNFPRAMIIATVLMVILNIIGALSIQMVIPKEEIGLASGIMQTFTVFFDHFNMSWLAPAVAIMIGFGALGQLTTWFLGPSKAMLAVAQDGNMPTFFHKTTKSGLPIVFMFLQAIILSVVTTVYLFVPSINAGFFMVLVLSVLLYAVVYLLIFASSIALRKKYPDHPRPYRVSKGFGGLAVVASIGIVSMIFCMIVSLVPPGNWNPADHWMYISFELGGLLLFLMVPFLIIRHMARVHGKENS